MNKIIIVIFIFIILTIFLGIYVTSGKTGGGGSGGGGGDTHKCPDGQTWFPQYGNKGVCLKCDPNDKNCGICSTDNDCKNDGKCVIYIKGNKGFCNCKSPYFGDTCEKICTVDGNQCKNGSVCTDNGTCNCATAPGWTGDFCDKHTNCTAENCQEPNCIYDEKTNTCSCKDGWTSTNEDLPKLCTVCSKGMGPKGQCDRVYFDIPISIATEKCYDTDLHSSDTLKQYCKNDFGQSATQRGKTYKCHNDSDCSPTSNHIICDIPQYYAYKEFDPKTFLACSQKAGENDASYLRNTYGFLPAN